MANATPHLNQKTKITKIKVVGGNGTISPLVKGKFYILGLLSNYQVGPETIIISGAEYINGQYISFSQGWFNYSIVFRATSDAVVLRGGSGNYWGLMRIN